MKQLFLLPPGWDSTAVVHHELPPALWVPGTHLYTWVEGGPVGLGVWLKNTAPWLDRGPLDLESSTLTLGPPCLHTTETRINSSLMGHLARMQTLP